MCLQALSALKGVGCFSQFGAIGKLGIESCVRVINGDVEEARMDPRAPVVPMPARCHPSHWNSLYFSQVLAHRTRGYPAVGWAVCPEGQHESIKSFAKVPTHYICWLPWVIEAGYPVIEGNQV